MFFSMPLEDRKWRRFHFHHSPCSFQCPAVRFSDTVESLREISLLCPPGSTARMIDRGFVPRTELLVIFCVTEDGRLGASRQIVPKFMCPANRRRFAAITFRRLPIAGCPVYIKLYEDGSFGSSAFERTRFLNGLSWWPVPIVNSQKLGWSLKKKRIFYCLSDDITAASRGSATLRLTDS